jgi:hypothetical protein
MSPNNETQISRFCRCIKRVRNTVKLRKGRGPEAREKAAIAICVKSVLQSRGRTLKRFSCRGNAKKLVTQNIK